MGKEQTTFRVAGVQISPVTMGRDGTTDKIIKNIEQCGREDIRLAVFPETIIPCYPYFILLNAPIAILELVEELYDQAIEVPGPETEAIGTAAAKSGTVADVGVNEREGGRSYGALLFYFSLFGDGCSLKIKKGKLHLSFPSFPLCHYNLTVRI